MPAFQALKCAKAAMSSCVMVAPGVFSIAVSSQRRRFASPIDTAAPGKCANRVVAVFDGGPSPPALVARI